MSSERLPTAEIEAMKARIEEHLDDVEAAAFALDRFMTDWRIRMAQKKAKERA